MSIRNRRQFLKESVLYGCAVDALISVPPLYAANQEDRPNILWLTTEDASSFLFSCYGNTDIKTPAIDKLASDGVRFSHAISSAPHCSPARSSLIAGCLATTYGMDFHSERVLTPDDLFFPVYFRKAGYYCTNNRKNDFNTTSKTIGQLWDERGDYATYASPGRKPGQPFFSMFNFGPTHMSRFCSVTLEGRPDLTSLGIDPSKLSLPSYVPDLPATRSDYALMLMRALECDAWVRAFVEDLGKKGLEDNTIIFFFGDNGGCLPRGKGFPHETGLRVPLVMYVPPKWQSKLRVRAGVVDDRMIGFEDLAPTALSLAGIQIPKHMQGKAFYGSSVNAQAGKLQFGFRTNQADHFAPCRTVCDGRYKYIRNYVPHKPFMLRNFFQWGMPANLAWDELMFTGNCRNADWRQPYGPQTSEMLFDLNEDPWELNNLASKPEYEAKLLEFRKALSQHIRQSGDLGFFPRAMRDKEGGLFQWVQNTRFPLAEMHDAVESASSPGPDDQQAFIKMLTSSHPELKYWGAIGFCTLASRGKIVNCPDELLKALDDANSDVAVAAADAVCYLGKPEVGTAKLFTMMEGGFAPAYSSLETLTWYEGLRQHVKVHTERLKTIAAKEGDGTELPMMARSLLINLGELPIEQLYTKEAIEAAKQQNAGKPDFNYSDNLTEMETRQRPSTSPVLK